MPVAWHPLPGGTIHHCLPLAVMPPLVIDGKALGVGRMGDGDENERHLLGTM